MTNAERAQLAEIWIYPIKSLPGAALERAEFLPAGPLRGDREWRLVDERGTPLNGKRSALVHALRADFEPDARALRLAHADGSSAGPFELERDAQHAADWIGARLGLALRLARDPVRSFPDDAERAGPTLVSRATLAAVGEWLGFDPEEARRRFRPNLVVAGVPAFWEDALLREEGAAGALRIGAVELEAAGWCRRCVVPTRQPESGVAAPGFIKRFLEQRELAWRASGLALPADQQFYRLAINTRLRGGAALGIQVGDALA